MATKRWIGDVAPVKQVTSCTFTTPGAGHIYALICGGAEVSHTWSSGEDKGDVIDALVTAIAAAGREWAEISASNVSDTSLKLQSVTAGIPFTVTDNSSGGATITVGTADPAATGPNHYVAGNFDTGTLPGPTDTIIFEDSDVDLLYGLEDPSGITGAVVKVYASYIGKIGLPETNSGGFPEYRPTFFKLKPAELIVGLGDGDGSPLIKIDGDARATMTLRCYGMAALEDAAEPAALQFQNATAITADISGGTIAFAPYGSITTSFTSLRATGAADVQCEDGCSITAIECGGSAVVGTEVNCTNVTISGGTVRTFGSVAISGTCLISGPGQLDHQSTGTIATLEMDDSSATADFSNLLAACTVSSLVFNAGRIIDPHGRLTISAISGTTSFSSG